MNNEITPFSEIKTSKIDINQVLKQGQQMMNLLNQMGLKEATFHDGTYFKNNLETETKVLSTNGILLEKGNHTTTITLRNENSSEEDALNEIKERGKTQKMLGAFSDKSQQEVSKTFKEENLK